MRERDSGRSNFSELTPLEWELIMVWDDYVAAHERAIKNRISQLFEMVAGMARVKN